MTAEAGDRGTTRWIDGGGCAGAFARWWAAGYSRIDERGLGAKRVRFLWLSRGMRCWSMDLVLLLGDGWWWCVLVGWWFWHRGLLRCLPERLYSDWMVSTIAMECYWQAGMRCRAYRWASLDASWLVQSFWKTRSGTTGCDTRRTSD